MIVSEADGKPGLIAGPSEKQVSTSKDCFPLSGWVGLWIKVVLILLFYTHDENHKSLFDNMCYKFLLCVPNPFGIQGKFHFSQIIWDADRPASTELRLSEMRNTAKQFSFSFLNSHPRICFYCLLENEEGGRRETFIDCLLHVPWLGIWESDPRFLVYGTMLQLTEPPGQGFFMFF